jgi:hypothetical protein
MAALAGFAMPRVNYVAVRLDANARIVRSAMQQAWRLSIQQQHDILVSIDTAIGRIRVLEDANNDGIPTAGERVTWRPLEEGVRFALPPSGVNGAVTGAVAGSGIRSVNGMPTLTYRRSGSTSGDAEIYLSAQSRAGMERRAVTISQTTGRTEWFKYVKSNWRSAGT